ncbi:MAG: DUF123 domain-containing protein [Candidatus Lokiarchaeota archaeon]|nr:DUF123 domain-containing protein [Candidatus Lokiarchaeota archaeon]MBD3340837.1 DUF123 domain-containing protein [Candidatus Lokiarchaeota archaeon]
MKGSYILLMVLPENQIISIGKLGSIFFKKGYYAYIGSAMAKFGSATLENRVRRHLKPTDRKKKHWHIDYLLEYAKIVKLFLLPMTFKIECIIANEVSENSEGVIPGFGSSDCNCRSHLFHFSRYPDFILKQ